MKKHNIFLITITTLLLLSCSTSKKNNEPVLTTLPKTNSQNIIFTTDFENNQVGNYTEEDFYNNWGRKRPKISSFNLMNILNENSNKILRVKYLENKFGKESMISFKVPLGGSYEELYCSYKIKFDKNFEFVKGGKLPGLAGGTANTGGRKPNGKDGWSTRLMWRREGKLVSYVYHPDQHGRYGEDFDWKYLKRDKWYTLKFRVKLNTIGKKDGIIEAWVDGEKVLFRNNLRFRDIENIKIDYFYFSTFFGGSNRSWAPQKEQYIYFDDFIVSKK